MMTKEHYELTHAFARLMAATTSLVGFCRRLPIERLFPQVTGAELTLFEETLQHAEATVNSIAGLAENKPVAPPPSAPAESRQEQSEAPTDAEQDQLEWHEETERKLSES